jgi:hypothetical protein
MMEEAAVEIDRQRKVISAMIEDCQYLKDKQIEAADEIEKLREALKPFAELKSVSWSLENDHYFIDTDDIRAYYDTLHGYAEMNGKMVAEIEALRAENAKLEMERNTFHRTYREVCDEEVKIYVVEMERLRAENALLLASLKETLEIASRNESGDYIQRARTAMGESDE